ncbi:NAD(P)H dehydrogenase (quinone) [Cnuella takakiae]|uniref:NAD(P)H dehydrogenase (Quinone) n=1 Tax=Cnuella takakiae TaxID=1302690 RepID=A0A1M4XTG9_9BACT|nr:NAD(P)H:quinone oxidoreductase [Cnuella takakiae]OLY92943.1 NAD(P)H:quinone oxidoreductase, type IV [Cnuella takakiae]SHE96904.1 NAD(P)H dehydrogenase (quinone) [Cnuella takakiae]
MAAIKLAIVYYSATGANYQLSQWAAEAATEAGAEVKICKAPELAPQGAIDSNPLWKAHVAETAGIPVVQLSDLEEADAYIFSVPTRYGAMAAQMKQFIDTTGGLWYHGKLANKVVSAMATAQNPHGGQESTLLNLYTTMFHWGCIIAGPGYTSPDIFAAGGNPYGASASVVDGQIQNAEAVRKAVAHQARRTVMIAAAVKNGLTQQ